MKHFHMDVGTAAQLALEEIETAVQRLRRTTQHNFTRDVRSLCWTLVDGALGERCRELTTKTSLEPWLAERRAQAPEGRLTWPAEAAEAAGLAIRCIGRFASDPESAAGFAAEFFGDDADPDVRLRRLVDDLIAPLPRLLRGLVTATPRQVKRRGLLMLGDEGRLRQLVREALDDLGFAASETSERPWASPGLFAEQLAAAETWTVLVVIGATDLTVAAGDAPSPGHAAIFDVGFLVGQLGAEAVIPLGGPGVKSLTELSALRPVAVHDNLPWRNVLAARLTALGQADGAAPGPAANMMT